MSRTPATYGITVVRGSTWEEQFVYKDPAGVAIDLTGYQARMQVRTAAGRFGTTTTTTLVMELTTANGKLIIPDQSVLADRGKVQIKVSAADTITLNPSNAKKVKLVYGLELYRPVGADPEYVIPLIGGSLTVLGETVR